MNYELAKELKDAGFPQETKGIGDRYFQFMGHPRMGVPYQQAVFTVIDPTIKHETQINEMVKIPTLSELIEACGEEFSDLVRLPDWRWACNDAEIVGSNPEEAVARLWLALNKK